MVGEILLVVHIYKFIYKYNNLTILPRIINFEHV